MRNTFRYLSGAPHEQAIRWQHGGLMFTPEMGNKMDLTGVVWAADNGCYSAGERFSLPRFLAFLERYGAYRDTCVFAVAPDVPFDAVATWERSRDILPVIRDMGYPAALAIQNGIQHVGVPWDDVDAVFIAGDRPFKTSQIARRICLEAKRHGKYVHIARRNSYDAVQKSYDMHADSVDGTYLRFGPDKNWPKMQGWFKNLCIHENWQAWGSDPRFGYCVQCRRQIWKAA